MTQTRATSQDSYNIILLSLYRSYRCNLCIELYIFTIYNNSYYNYMMRYCVGTK